MRNCSMIKIFATLNNAIASCVENTDNCIPPLPETRFQFQHMLESLNERGFSLLGMGGQAFQQFATVLPGWYQRRIHELLGIHVPRRYARRFYNTILGHQYHLSQNEGRNVSLERAAKDWYTRYHLPAILFLRQHLTKWQDPLH